MASVLRARQAQDQLSHPQQAGTGTFAAGGTTLHFGKAGPEHAAGIVSLVNRSHANGGEVLPISIGIAHQWVASGDSYIVIDAATKEVVSHNSVTQWSAECFELRSAVTKKEYQGNGINIALKSKVIEDVFAENPNAVIISLKNGSNGLGSLMRLGFVEEELGEAMKRYGFKVLKPEEGPWHVYVLRLGNYKAVQLSGMLRDA
ncbi:MAG: hypothetical protein KGH72_04645 [Candidatus Micrarchaeota archaeon]|nr:hypothetical protein [Candidatus Micrarchaeota archaeon]